MNIIITAGGTTEKIDEVRVISNFSTGRLGLSIAKAFLENDNLGVEKIYYICDKNHMNIPVDNRVEIVRVSGVDGLLDGLRTILTTKKIGAVIHAMAVSDYAVRRVTTLDEIKNNGFDYNKKGMVDNHDQPSGKISSEIEDLVIILKKTPKVIGEIKKFQKETLLVGFKLLSNVDKNTLIETGYKLLEKNDCDMVLANDLSEITGERHGGYLIFPNKELIRLENKDQIAQAITSSVEKILEEKRDESK